MFGLYKEEDFIGDNASLIDNTENPEPMVIEDDEDMYMDVESEYMPSTIVESNMDNEDDEDYVDNEETDTDEDSDGFE